MIADWRQHATVDIEETPDILQRANALIGVIDDNSSSLDEKKNLTH
jgi:hypothetical protein